MKHLILWLPFLGLTGFVVLGGCRTQKQNLTAQTSVPVGDENHDGPAALVDHNAGVASGESDTSTSSQSEETDPHSEPQDESSHSVETLATRKFSGNDARKS